MTHDNFDRYKPQEPEETCPGCHGSGVQTNKDGLRVWCPLCGGSGKIKRRKKGHDPFHPSRYRFGGRPHCRGELPYKDERYKRG